MIEKRLLIQDFIKNNKDWEKILINPPYCINISRDRVFNHDLVLFKYDQQNADFNNPIVRECRGLILDENSFEKITVPFFKFGNYGESYCPTIDWSSSYVGEKIDGSLIKIVNIDNNLLISTNGTIDAFKATIANQPSCEAHSYGELVLEALKTDNLTIDTLKPYILPNHTYMFEITSPYNKVVVSWNETRLYFLGERDNITLEETYFNASPLTHLFKTPRIYPLKSLYDCIEASNHLLANEEGYVVCDKDFNRIKIKSPLYVSLHHMANNHIMTYERGLEIVRKNEIDEVLTYFPEFEKDLLKIKSDLANLLFNLKDSYSRYLIKTKHAENRKEQAVIIQKTFRKHSAVGFLLLDKRINSIEEWLNDLTTTRLMKHLGYKD
jgi:hypothetical protein